jgi:ribosomal protein S18 acetylase RimI-like enzyme
VDLRHIVDLARHPEVVHCGPDRFRVAPWRDAPGVAVLIPMMGYPASATSIDYARELLGSRGVRRLLTAALPPAEQAPFLDRGFTVREPLHLLVHDLQAIPSPVDVSPVRLRRGWRRDYPAALTVDAAAFDRFWRFDLHALRESRTATPSNRFRVAVAPDLVGFAVTGRNASTCYLQRLTVDPEHHRHGIGRALVVDALRWARSRRVERMLVNTQVANEAALSLYEQLGFVRAPEGLAVLEQELEPAVADR